MKFQVVVSSVFGCLEVEVDAGSSLDVASALTAATYGRRTFMMSSSEDEWMTKDS